MGDRWKNLSSALTGRRQPPLTREPQWSPRAAPTDRDPAIDTVDYDFDAARQKPIPFADMEASLQGAVDDEFAPKAAKDPKSSHALALELAHLEHELARAKVLLATAEVEITKKRTELDATIERERQEELKMHTDRLAELEALRPTNGGGLPNENDRDVPSFVSGGDVPRVNGASGADPGVPVAGADPQG